MGSMLSKPKPTGPSEEELAAQKKSAARADASEERANKQLSSAARFATKRRTGRRLLLAPGREDEIATLGGSGGEGGTSGGNF